MADDVMLESPTDAVVEGEQSPVDASLAELERALGGDEAAAKKVVPPVAAKPGEQPPAAVVPPAAEKTPEQLLDEKLGTIDEPKPDEKPAQPALSAEQKQILEVFPSTERATEVLTLANGYTHFTNAFVSDPVVADAMLEKWNPEATEAFREHLFDKYVRNGDWVDRWIAEKEGRAEENRDVRALKGEVQKLKTQLTTRQAQETTQAQSQAFQNTVNGFVSHVEGLFKTIDASDETDKKIIWSMVNSGVSSNPALKSKILSGDYKAVNGVFKEASRTYYGKNKAAVVSKEVAAGAQAAHKPAIGAGVMQELSSALPDDIKDVPKGQEDAWLDQALGKLATKAGRKK